MSDTVAEAAVASMIGAAYGGEPEPAPTRPRTVVEASSEEPPREVEKFEFDAEFQTRLATHVVRDVNFMRKVGHLIEPGYFENAGEAAIVNIALRFWRKYGQLPDHVAAMQMFKEDLTTKVIRGDIKHEAVEAFRTVYKKQESDLGNGDFFAEQVALFAKHQALSMTILNSVDWLGQRRFDKIENGIKAALAVGLNEDGEEYDYFEKIEERTQRRLDRLAGILPPTGITTGIRQLDELLYHKGWGRRELSVLMGGPKTGKTTGLIGFAKFASLAGFNVLYVTLEVSRDIISERMDACVTDVLMKELGVKANEVKHKVAALHAKAGKLRVAEYPSGTFTPAMLRALLARYKSPAMRSDGTTREPIKFDLIVVDYADIMKPDHRTDSPIENSKQVWLDLRAIADQEDAAMLSATATNREGIKATVATMDTVADDINKARTVDLMISINKTEEEAAAGEARLFFAASRNQESGFTVFIKQDIARMKFISAILRVE